MDQRLDNLWKDFGRESEAGKLLFQLYKVRNKPQVYYPPVKVKKKPLPCDELRSQSTKKPSIDYPPPQKPRRRKFHPIDFVPRRKQQQAINSQLQSNYRENLPPAKGKNRDQMKTDLQQRFQFSQGALPKSVIKASSVPRVAPKPSQAKKEEISNNPSDLFDMIVKEIQERQKFLEQLEALGQLNPDTEFRMKGEIASRISELQKIREMS